MVVGREGKKCFKVTFKNSQGHASTIAMSIYNDTIPTISFGLTTGGSIVKQTTRKVQNIVCKFNVWERRRLIT